MGQADENGNEDGQAPMPNNSRVSNVMQSPFNGNSQQVRTFSEVHQLIMNTRLSADKTPLVDGKYGDISGIKEEEEIYEDTQRTADCEQQHAAQQIMQQPVQLTQEPILMLKPGQTKPAPGQQNEKV